MLRDLLDRVLDLFRGPDPASEWEAAEPHALTLDLRTGDLEGVRPGAPWTELERFGRPANARPYRTRTFVYPAMGAVFLTLDDRFVGADLALRAESVHGEPAEAARAGAFSPARLRIVLPGGWPVEVVPDTSPAAVRGRFGLPAAVDEDPEWLGLAYRLGDWELEFEFGRAPERPLHLVSLTWLREG